MQKKLIALAIAGAVFAPAAMADSSNVTIYGVLHMSVDSLDAANTAGNTSNKSVNVSNNSSRLGFRGSEDLGNGLKFNWQAEGALAIEEAAGGAGVFSNAGTSLRNSYMGLSGKWGEVRFGRHDTPYKLADGKARGMFDDTVGDYGSIIGGGTAAGAWTGASSLWEGRVDNVMAYISPTWNGFHVAVARSAYNAAGATPAGQDGNDQVAYSAVAVYANGPWNASLGWEKRNDTAGAEVANSDADAVKVALGYDNGTWQVNFVYEDQDADAASAAAYRERKNYVLNGGYTFGNNRVIAQYGKAKDSSKGGVTVDDGAKAFALGLEHSLSKRTNAYVMYSKVTNDTAGAAQVTGSGHGDTAAAVADYDQKAWSIGMRHSF